MSDHLKDKWRQDCLKMLGQDVEPKKKKRPVVVDYDDSSFAEVAFPLHRRRWPSYPSTGSVFFLDYTNMLRPKSPRPVQTEEAFEELKRLASPRRGQGGRVLGPGQPLLSPDIVVTGGSNGSDASTRRDREAVGVYTMRAFHTGERQYVEWEAKEPDLHGEYSGYSAMGRGFLSDAEVVSFRSEPRLDRIYRGGQ